MAFTPIVSSSQTVIGETVTQAQGILSGGTAIATTLYGWQYVSSGGIVLDTAILSGGEQYVESGGVANCTTISSGGQQFVLSGASANVIKQQTGAVIITNTGATINNGSNTRTDGHSTFSIVNGTASNFLLESGGLLNVSSGHSAIDTVISSGGQLLVSTGGIANMINQQAGAVIITNTGATINNGSNTRTDGHSTFSIVNGTASNFLLEKGGSLTILSGQSAIDTVIAYGGNMNISSGGTANVINQQAGGTIITNTYANIANGTNIRSDGHSGFSIINGIASNFLLENNGKLTILSGHSAIDTVIASGGEQYIASGGVANSTTINLGGRQFVGGMANSAIISSSGTQTVFSGGIANSTTIYSGGTQCISAGGVANYTTISGAQYISSGGVANYTRINYCQVVSSGGVANSTIIQGYQVVSSGGAVNSTTINSGGEQYISSGGIANSITINSGGSQFVYGGTANMINQLTGGAIVAYTGAKITGGINTRTDGHSAFSIISGIASNFLLENEGRLIVLAGHSAINTIINSGGWQCVDSGGGANSTTINSRGRQYISSGGTVISATINSGGEQYISSGGVANSITINSGGSQFVYGGTANVINQQSGGAIVVYTGAKITIGINTRTDGHSSFSIISGIASNFLLERGGQLFVSSGHSAIDTVIASAGTQYISFGGVANITTVNAWGSMCLSSGGVANITTVNAWGSMCLSSGGVANSTTISSGGSQIVYSGGTANVINQQSGGAIVAYTGAKITGGINTRTDGYNAFSIISGIASNFLLEKGGRLTVLSGHSAVNTVIALAGSQIVCSGGVTSNMIVNFGGSMYVSSGGIVSRELTIDGGHVLVDYSDNLQVSTMNFKLANSQANDTLLIINSGKVGDISHTAFTLDVNNTTTGLYILSSGVELSGLSGAVFTVFDNGQNVNVQVGSSYIFADGDKLSLSLSDATIDQLTATFTVGKPADIISPSIPSGLIRTINGNNVSFDWNDSTDGESGIKQYEVQLDKHADFSSPEYTASPVASNVNFTGLADGTFFWRVRTQDNSGNYSAWSGGSGFVSDVANNAAGALLLSNPSTTGWVGLGDAGDFYKLTMSNAGTLTLGLTGLTGNANLTLLDAKGVQLKASSNSGIANESIVQMLLAGNYYVKVAPAFGVNDAAYTLTHAEKYCPADTAVNTWQTAKSIDDGVDNWVGFGDAADVYKLIMTSAGTLSLGLNGLSGNADLSLLSSTGTTLKTSAKTGPADEAINNVLLLAGTYYVKVAPGTGVNDAAYTLTHTEKYTPADKAANDYKTALDISTLDNWVGFGDAADFYKLTMTNAGMLTFGLTGLTGNADLSLLNASGMQLKTSSNTGTTPEAITNVALLAGTYYVKVATGYGVNDAGYTLTHTEKYTPADTGANTWQTARNIDDGVDNWVGFGDAADFYKLTMTNAGTLTLGLTGLTGNADLTLLNASGMQLKASSSTGTTSEAINNVALLAGTYYVKVATGFGVNDASYTLAHTEKYCPSDKAANDYKAALDISNLDNWVGFGDSADFYKLTMANAGTVTLGLTGLTGNADLALLNSAGTALKTSAKAGTANEAITGVSLLAGTYYVKVATGFGVNDASYNLSNTVSYFPGDTSDKAGNTLAAAKLVDSPAQTGWVGFGDADDYYKFDIAAAAQGTLRLYDMAGGNADLTLYDAKGVQLQKSAKTGALEDTITRNLAAGTYYARVNAVSGNIDYKLDFSKKDGYGMLAS